MHLDRRALLVGGTALGLSACVRHSPVKTEIAPPPHAALAALEAQSGGRLGVFIRDIALRRSAGHRFEERFGMCSTFKLSLAAMVFRLSEQGKLKLDEVLPYTKADLLPTSPVTTEKLAQGGMTVEELARATQMTSDNAAANLLLRRIGGPAAVTAFWRSLGDNVSRLDRYETEMNLVPPGEVRDTTSPMAIAGSMAQFLTGDVLSAEHREKLIGWMAETQTGLKRIRGGLPPRWRQGDKTGTGLHESFADKYNDLAIFWPRAGTPVIVTCFYEGPGHFDRMRDEDQAVLAEVGRIAAAQAAEWHGGLD